MTNKRYVKKYQKESDCIDAIGVVFNSQIEKDVVINSIVVGDWITEREILLMGIGFTFLVSFLIGIYFYSLGSLKFHLISFGITFFGFLILTFGFIAYVIDSFRFKKYKNKYDKEIEKTVWTHFEEMQDQLLEEIRGKQNQLEEIENDEQ